MKTIFVLAIVFASYFILKFLQLVINRLGKRYNMIRIAETFMPLVVSITWLIVVFWSAHYLFKEKSYYNLVVICMIVILSALIGWFFIKDFIAGVFFRVQNNYDLGDYVQLGDVSGKIEALLLTHISLNTKEGKILRIPYSRLSSEIISQRTESITFEENNFILKTDRKENLKSTQESIRIILMTSPWRISSAQPAVKFIAEDDQSYSFEIQVQARNQKHFNYLVEVLEKRFGHLK